MPTKSRLTFVLACALLSFAACSEDDSQCGAAGVNTIAVQLHRTDWPDGEYTMRVRYEASPGDTRHDECVFVLPHTGNGEAVCEEAEWPFASVSIGATVTMGIHTAPRTIELTLDSPNGEVRELMITPQYESYEVCGSSYYTGFEQISLDNR
jgi:hypothetical protein